MSGPVFNRKKVKLETLDRELRVRITEAMQREVDRAANDMGVSTPEFIRQLIRDCTEPPP